MKIYDVIQVGYGPVGQTMAHLLGSKGYEIAVFEKWPALFSLPRAAAFDHEVMRVFQEIGIANEVDEQIIPIKRYQWVNAQKELLLEVPYGKADISGWENGYLMYQPKVEATLHARVATLPNVALHQGWQVEGLVTHADYNEITVHRGEVDENGQWVPTEDVATYYAKYVIGADGANSFVRRSLDIGQRDLGFGERFAVIDYKPNDPLVLDHLPEAYQICNPLRPTTLIKRLGSEHMRFEFMILPHEDPATFLEQDNVESLISAWITPSEGQIVRKTMYKFSSLIADCWYKDNVFLVGDAAHVTPPFMGQGMCSGIRDAKNLAWKLDLVLQGVCDAKLFDTYQLERYPHAETLIDMAIGLGKVICVPSLEAAAERDALFMSGEAPPMPPMPHLIDGLLYKAADGSVMPNAGLLSFQSSVKYNGVEGLFDDVVAKGWVLYTFNEHILSDLSAAQQSALRTLGVHIAILSDVEQPDVVVDIHGHYRAFFNEHQFETVLVRPDYYMFGTVAHGEDVQMLVQSLLEQLAMQTAVTD